MELPLSTQVLHLFILAIPAACVAWTVTHEEVFREPREYCVNKSRKGRTIWTRKFFYLFTCEYCFSHYVVLALLLLTNFRLILPGFGGYILSFFSLVWIANVYMSLFAIIRVGLKKERAEAVAVEKQIREKESCDSREQA